MYNNFTREELIRKIKDLETIVKKKENIENRLDQVLTESTLRNKELKALRQGARAVLEQKGFKEAARSIFDYCRDLIGAPSGYVALLSDNGEENEVLFLESGGLPCNVDPELPMPIRGLRSEAYRDLKTVYHNNFMNSHWVKFMPQGHVSIKNVLFAPLILAGKAVGLIGLANKKTDFDENDAQIATEFGELAAIALQNSKSLDNRIKAEQEKEKIIEELREAMAWVKKLSGLLPICSSCKKIRDDKGDWNHIESYIREHSEAEFSHSICPTCIEKHYPDFDVSS
jgi:hypothetical protein